MKRKIIIELDYSSDRQHAMCMIAPTIDGKFLEKYFFPIEHSEKTSAFEFIEKKLTERANANPEIYKEFGA